MNPVDTNSQIRLEDICYFEVRVTRGFQGRGYDMTLCDLGVHKRRRKGGILIGLVLAQGLKISAPFAYCGLYIWD